MTRSLILTTVWLSCMGAATSASAQQVSPGRREFWVASGLAIGLTLPLDERIRDLAAQHHTARLDRIAVPIGNAGSPGYILPALAVGAVLPRLMGDPATSNNVIDIGFGYVVASGTGMILRWAIGRHRPDSAGGSLRFSPMSREHEWHSFPSGHMVGAMALATGISIKANRPWVTTASYGLASLVGLQRLYTENHWASDLVAGTVLAIFTSASTVRWRERRRSPTF